jgi:photosystem II stability/assembly factor-like uncharacterized protein
MTTSTERSTTESMLVVATPEGLHLPHRAEPELGGRRIGSLTIDGNTVWALVDSVELHRVTPNEPAKHVATLDDGTATCVHVHHGTVFVGGDDAALWRLEDGALEPVESFLDAPTRVEWYTPWGGPPSVLSMASHGDDLYVGVHVGGILRSADGGSSWSDTIDLHVDVHQVVTDADGAVWAATGERALGRSRDRGASWEFHADGLHATYSLALAITSAGVLAGASSGHAGRDGAVSLFDGSRFAPVEGLPDHLGGAVGPRQIAAHGDHAALVAPGGEVYASDDGGRRWHPVEHLTGASAIALAPSSAC